MPGPRLSGLCPIVALPRTASVYDLAVNRDICGLYFFRFDKDPHSTKWLMVHPDISLQVHSDDFTRRSRLVFRFMFGFKVNVASTLFVEGGPSRKRGSC